MLSEACAVGCPVHTFTMAPLPARIARFHQALRTANLLHDIDDTAASPQPPLRETAALAKELLARIARRQND
jgi:mitochondrial fission protein ELM1